MRYRVRTEDIYDAAIDDAAFERLPALLAHAVGARSAVLHWGHDDNECAELVDNGYFSDEHMSQYDRHFAKSDLWAEAMNLPSVANRGWNCEQLIPPRTYEMSRIYNEWVRPMGDDTFHCLGAVIRGDWGSGKIGFHRGRRQAAFDDVAVDVFNSNLAHLRRMLNIRARLGRAEAKERLTHASLDALGDGVLTLSMSGRLLHANAAAECLLRRGDGLYVSNDRICARNAGDQLALRAALLRAADAAATEGAGLLVQRSGGGSYAISMVSARAGSANRQIVVVVNETGPRETGVEGRIREMFGLTPSEAQLARRLAEGATADEVAAERGTAIGTVRSQLKSVAAKLGCGRQAEIVRMVKDLPRLHATE